MRAQRQEVRNSNPRWKSRHVAATSRAESQFVCLLIPLRRSLSVIKRHKASARKPRSTEKASCERHKQKQQHSRAKAVRECCVVLCCVVAAFTQLKLQLLACERYKDHVALSIHHRSPNFGPRAGYGPPPTLARPPEHYRKAIYYYYLKKIKVNKGKMVLSSFFRVA